jgi:hypothetical protein
MTDEQSARLDALGSVLALFRGVEDLPAPADLIAYAEWVVDGSISTATALEGQKAALYSERRREEDL